MVWLTVDPVAEAAGALLGALPGAAVVPHADSVPASHVFGLEGALGRPLPWRVVSDGKRTTAAINDGEPFVWTDRDAGISQAIDRLAHWLLGKEIAPS
ncbi:MAG: hypothetical protein ACHP7G_08625, partial [Actinomycetales bacterium]